jgi:hypothetical protein
MWKSLVNGEDSGKAKFEGTHIGDNSATFIVTASAK